MSLIDEKMKSRPFTEIDAPLILTIIHTMINAHEKFHTLYGIYKK